MAISDTTITNLEDYTDGQIVKMIRYAIIQIMASGQSYSINGRTFTRANVKDLKELLTFFEDRVEAESSTTGTNIALVEFRGL